MLHAYQIVYAAVVTLTCGFTVCAGGRTERTALGIIVIASLTSVPAAVLALNPWDHMMPGEAIIDLMTTLAFFLLMVRSRAFWPIWSFGFCLAMMMAHLMRYVQHSVPPWSYYDTTSLWAYPILGSVALGAVEHRWRRLIATC